MCTFHLNISVVKDMMRIQNKNKEHLQKFPGIFLRQKWQRLENVKS